MKMGFYKIWRLYDDIRFLEDVEFNEKFVEKFEKSQHDEKEEINYTGIIFTFKNLKVKATKNGLESVYKGTIEKRNFGDYMFFIEKVDDYKRFVRE